MQKYNILLSMDEVQTGFGRTGENFAHQLFGVKPDIGAAARLQVVEFCLYLLLQGEMMSLAF